MDWQGTRLRTGVTRLSTVPSTSDRKAARPAIPASLIDPIRSCEVFDHYPLPNRSGKNNYTRTAVEPDNQDQFDTRLDRNFGANHRVFGRYSYFRDNDTPVTPLPDGSGSLTSGVIGHALTRGDQGVAEWDWSFSPSTLNQARFGFTRRDLNQTSLQNGDITVPGAPANSFASVLPIFVVTGYQQIGPTSAANAKFTTSVTEYLDTFSMVRGRHTIKFGTDIRREALDVLHPPNPTGSYTFTATGEPEQPGVAAAGPGECVHHRYSKPAVCRSAPISRSFSWATIGKYLTGSR